MRCSSVEIPCQDNGLRGWLEVWVQIVVGSILLISVSSLFSQMEVGCWMALGGSLVWFVRQYGRGVVRFTSAGLAKDWPFWGLAGLCFLSLLAGPHCFLDTFSYRLPQMLLWLQEGHPWSVPNVDMRINQMPHVWAFIDAMFLLPFGERGMAVPNFISFLLLYGILRDIARHQGLVDAKARWIVMIFIASPVMVMQSATNDNVITCVTFLMISAWFALTQKPSTASVVYSALSFSLCCGVKPQYVTLAPLWALWFFAGREAPSRVFRWRALTWMVPLAILCSPLPSFVVNQTLHGSFSHPEVVDEADAIKDRNDEGQDDGQPGTEKKTRLLHSFFSLGNQMLALPVNPLAGRMTEWIRSQADNSAFLKRTGIGRQRIYPLPIPEGASLGFFATIPLCLGCVLAIRRKQRDRLRPVLVGVGSVAAMVVAIFLIAPGTLGRSFVGFLALLFPLCFLGLGTLRFRILKGWGILCLLLGMVTVILNPAAPLWPVRFVEQRLTRPGIKRQLQDYRHYSRRHRAAAGLVAQIPESESVIGAVVQAGRPVGELWKPQGLGRRVLFFPPDVTRERLERESVSYLILRHPRIIGDDGQPKLEFLSAVGGTLIGKEVHTSYMQFGAEPWCLVRISEAGDQRD